MAFIPDVPPIDRTRAAMQAAHTAEAVVLEDPGGGLNASLDAAGRELLGGGARSLLVVLGGIWP